MTKFKDMSIDDIRTIYTEIDMTSKSFGLEAALDIESNQIQIIMNTNNVYTVNSIGEFRTFFLGYSCKIMEIENAKSNTEITINTKIQ